MFIEAWVPNRPSKAKFSARAKRKTAAYKLDRFLQRYVGSWCEQYMHMIRHENELMDGESLFESVIAEDVEQQFTEAIRLQKKSSLERGEGNKEGADFLWCKAQG